jgi:hypothetical protein
MGVSAFCTILEPAFGYFLLILYQNDFFGIVSLSGGAAVLSMRIGGSILIAQFLVAFVFMQVLSVLELGGPKNCMVFILKIFCCPVFMLKCCVNMCIEVLTRRPNDEPVFEIDDSGPLFEPNAIGPRIRIPGQLDPDIAAEKEKVKRIFDQRVLNPRRNAIFIHELRKIYFARGTVPTKIAVKDINLNIPHGEVFGLLGANGELTICFR